jgi:hypothetical protein
MQPDLLTTAAPAAIAKLCPHDHAPLQLLPGQWTLRAAVPNPDAKESRRRPLVLGTEGYVATVLRCPRCRYMELEDTD